MPKAKSRRARRSPTRVVFRADLLARLSSSEIEALQKERSEGLRRKHRPSGNLGGFVAHEHS
jgi:hypothetical protein